MTSKRRKMDFININNHLNSLEIDTVTNTGNLVNLPSTSNFNELCHSPSMLPNSASAVSLGPSENSTKNEQDMLLCYNQADLFKKDHSSKLLKILNSQRNDKSLCDYEIRVNGESFYCHKCVLISMSDFFNVMLTGTFFIFVMYMYIVL